MIEIPPAQNPEMVVDFERAEKTNAETSRRPNSHARPTRRRRRRRQRRRSSGSSSSSSSSTTTSSSTSTTTSTSTSTSIAAIVGIVIIPLAAIRVEGRCSRLRGWASVTTV